MDNTFSTSSFCDNILLTSEFEEDKALGITLYAYMDKTNANNLFRFYLGTFYNYTAAYLSTNPLQVPITLYESRENAKILATPGNTQLVAFSINNSDKRYFYDAFDLSLGAKLKRGSMTLAQFKARAHILREKRKQGNSEYIAYEIRDKSMIQSIQLQD